MNSLIKFTGISILSILMGNGLLFVAAPLCADISFRDDFDSNNNQWKSYNDSELSLDVRAGKLIIESRKEKVITSWNYIRRHGQGNYRISAEITRESGPQANDAGLAVKNSAGMECYLGIFGDSRYVITAYGLEKGRNVIRTGFSDVISNTSNILQIEIKDRQVRFLVNNNLIEEVVDFYISDFWIGFRVGPRIRISADYIELSNNGE